MSRDTFTGPERRFALPARLALMLGILVVVALGVVWFRADTAADEQRSVKEGLQLAQEGQIAEAERLWKKVVQDNPDNARGWELLATLYGHSERFPEAIDALRRVTKLKPGKAISYARIAECLERTGDKEGALQQAREALKRDPNSISALTTAVSVLGKLKVEKEKIDDERRLTLLQPDNTAYLGMFAIDLVHNDLYQEARPVIENLIRLDPNNPDGYNLRGEIEYYQDPTPHGLKQAAADFQKTLQIRPDAFPPKLFLGKIYTRLGQPEKAIACLLEAKRMSPEHGEIDYPLGDAYEQAGQASNAEAARQRFATWNQEFLREKALEKRCALQRDNFEIHLEVGKIKLRKHELPAAAFYLGRASQLRPADTDIKNALKQLALIQGAAQTRPSTVPGGP